MPEGGPSNGTTLVSPQTGAPVLPLFGRVSALMHPANRGLPEQGRS
jgi:hypothetical protein